MNKKDKEFLLEKYNVIYDTRYDAWRRLIGGDMTKFELGIITEYITKDNVLTKGHNFVKYQDEEIEEKVCICGCNRCNTLNKLYHNYSDNVFLVGSKCITKAGGQEEYENNKKCAKKNGLCRECFVPIIYKGHRANAKKNNNNYCNECYNKLYKEEKIYLNISFANKDKYKALGTRWDANKKKWYWMGSMLNIPKDLKCLIP